MTLTLAFHGAAGTVTGSRFLLTAGKDRLLIDCGQFQGLKRLREKNWEPLPFEANSVDAIALTHAHIDHTGYLPVLVARGFRGPIYCTPATADLVEILLLDAAHIQEEDAAYANRKGFSKHRPALPLFTEDDARRALDLLQPVEFGSPFRAGSYQLTFHPAGHILGSSFVEVVADTGNDFTRIVFSGDLGRYDMPLHVDPSPIVDCDTLVLESTYGDRSHARGTLGEQLRDAFLPVLKRGGVILIPAFAVARAQLITLILRELIESGELPAIPIHIDSPMAVDVTETYNRYLHDNDLDEDLPGASRRKLFPRDVRFHRSPDESKALNDATGPRIIISASGMLTGGRVLHHLRCLLPNPAHVVALVGYQAVGTRGRDLQNGVKYLRVHGQDIPVRAKVVTLEGFSAHADAHELLRWAFDADNRPGNVFLVHGEPEATKQLAALVRERGATAIRPNLHDVYLYNNGAWTQVESG